MSASKAQQAITAKRRAECIQLRLAGVDWETIAERLKYASRGAACEDFRRALEATRADVAAAAEDAREIEAARLDRLQAGFWAKAIKGDKQAGEMVLRILARRARMLGLDSPAQVAVDATVRFELVGVNPDEL